jgi:hypothetical protein
MERSDRDQSEYKRSQQDQNLADDLSLIFNIDEQDQDEADMLIDQMLQTHRNQVAGDKDHPHPIVTGIQLIFGLYLLIGSFIMPYFQWQYAVENGFWSWLFFGTWVSILKCFVWPFYI